MKLENNVELFSKGVMRRDPMTFAELLFVVKLYKFYYIAFSVLLLAATGYSHLSYVSPFVASAKVAMQSTSKAKSNPLGGLAELAGGGAIRDSEEEQLGKYVAYLRSGDFMLHLAQEIKFRHGQGEFDLTNPLARKITFWNRVRGIVPPPSGDSKDFTLVPLEKVAEMLPALISVKPGEQSSILITASAVDAKTAMSLANLVADTFTGQAMNRDSQEIGEVQSFIEARLRETTAKLQASELELVTYKQKNHVVSSQDSTRQVQDRYGRLESDIEQTRLRLNELERLRSYYEQKLSAHNKEMIQAQQGSGVPDEANQIRTRIETLRKQQSALRAQGIAENDSLLTSLGKDLTKDTEKLRSFYGQGGEMALESMDGTEIQDKIASLKNEIKHVSVKVGELEKSKTEMRPTLVTLPEQEQEVLRLDRAVALQYELYTQLKKRLQEIEIEKAGLKNPVRIEELAKGAAPILPPRLWLRLLFAELAALFMGCVVALVSELLNTTTRSRSDLEVAELISLGNVPFVGRDSKRHRNLRSRPDLLVCANAPDSAESMAFKFLRAQLRNILSGAGAGSSVISITSSERAAGKSMVSANLGVCFSQLNQKTILIDCDIRNPSLPYYFGYQRQDGLSELLEMKASLSNVLIADHLPNLDILPAGTLDRNPTEILSGERFAMLISFLRKKYKYVIIDSPPALFVVDAALVTAASDATILVARYRQTKKQALITAHRKIQQIAPKTIYGILNGVKDVHEYTNYNANSYFEKKLLNLRSYVDFKKRRESAQEGLEFEDFLTDGKSAKEVKRGS